MKPEDSKQPVSDAQQAVLGPLLPEHVEDFQTALSETARLYTELLQDRKRFRRNSDTQRTQEYLLASIIRLRGRCDMHITALIQALSDTHLRECRKWWPLVPGTLELQDEDSPK